jgi:hypothetical protein
MSDRRKIRISRFDRTVQILQVLYWRFDGMISDPHNASGILRAELIKVFGEEAYGDEVASSFSSTLKEMEESGVLVRNLKGRRTTYLSCTGVMDFWADNIKAQVLEGELLLSVAEADTQARIALLEAEAEAEAARLVDEAVAARIQATEDRVNSSVSEAAHALAERIKQPVGPIADVVDSYVRVMPEGIGTFPTEHDVARALLEQCMEILQRPEQLKDRLGEQTTVAQRLQRQNDALNEDLRAADQVNKDLRERLAAALRRCDELQKNVNTLAAERIILDPSRRKEFEKLMRAFPIEKGGST